ncbi:hypothetical protein L9F63_022360, partial [Diploptera punctata]
FYWKNMISHPIHKVPIRGSYGTASHQIQNKFLFHSRPLATKNNVPPYPEYPHPIYGSDYGKTFGDWATNWSLKMMSQVLSGDIKSVFEYCIVSIKRDLQTALFFLPYIVVHGIICSTKETYPIILEEIYTVISEPNKPDEAAVKKRDLSSRSELQTKCAKAVFNIIDFVVRFLEDWTAKHISLYTLKETDLTHKSLDGFLNDMDMLLLSRANYKCGEYSRALMYLETYVKYKPHAFQDVLWLFLKIYARLNDCDAIHGIIAVRETEATLEETMICHKATGQLQAATAYYENLDMKTELRSSSHASLIQCYLGLDQPLTALRKCQEIAARTTDMVAKMEEFEAEAFWRLCDFDSLNNLVEKTVVSPEGSWNMSLSHAILSFTRARLVAHILAEVDEFHEVVERIKNTSDMSVSMELARNCMKEWKQRLEVVKHCSRIQEEIMCIRRAILMQSVKVFQSNCSSVAEFFYQQIGNSWVESAITARSSTAVSENHCSILSYDFSSLFKVLFVEKAKLLWAKGDKEAALTCLQQGLKQHLSQEYDSLQEYYNNVSSDDQKINAEGKLLLATYLDENTYVDVDANINNYQEAVNACVQWEKSYVCLAQYYERALSNFKTTLERNVDGSEMQLNAVMNYAESLTHGCQYIYKALPCLLTLWLDLGTEYSDPSRCPRYKEEALAKLRSSLLKMNEIIRNLIKTLPSYLFLPVYSQLISRVCHPDPSVFLVIKEMLTVVLSSYPQQALWMTVAVYNSTNQLRARRCGEVIAAAGFSSPESKKFLKDFLRLTQKLLVFTDMPINENHKKNDVYSVSRIVPALEQILSSPTSSRIILPIQKHFNIVLPEGVESYAGHQVYQQNEVYFHRVQDEFTVISSQQKPRKITIVGSDGKEYYLLCKSRDDLRKDFRYMEFCNVVNSYLAKDEESRQRNLQIRTYYVAPLNECSGVIEWVPNMVPFRSACIVMYRRARIYQNLLSVRELLKPEMYDLATKRKCFMERVLPIFPSILNEWFRAQFPQPHKWMKARTAYIQTTAVMSMVGYILGLGDRHGENILFDTMTGEVMHVDFNCLFNKGLLFAIPERVPFRLTHNIVCAMGPLGVEGHFRKCCEITLRLLRSNGDTLTSVLRPFIYDPIVSWDKQTAGRGKNTEYTNELAVKNLKDLERRLQGMVKSKGKECYVALSVEGQVNSLILEATDINNLCQMYFGWAPFL